MFGRLFALPAGTVPIVLNVDVPDRALTAAFQAAGAALAAIHPPCPGPGDDPGHRAAIREAIGFAIKGVLIAAGRTPDPYRWHAFPEGRAFLTPAARPTGPGSICGTPRTAASSATPEPTRPVPRPGPGRKRFGPRTRRRGEAHRDRAGSGR